MADCPTAEDLERFIARVLPQGAAREVSTHVTACPSCAQWVHDAQANATLLDTVARILQADSVDVPGAHRGERQAAPTEALLPASIPARIGAFRVLRVLGEGGMGIVYEAEQEHPRRTVALKVVRPGLASAERLRRFGFEAEIQGRLRHPGIAPIFEAGTAEVAGAILPYFVMERVDGQPLLEYARQEQLSTRSRLELFVKVCDAVQYAHQNGVIHRDLKPGNIVVDASGQPKILDFGVARAADLDLALTLEADVGRIVGTLQYMSPEQCDGDPARIDTRSDVYSLGMVLYELVCRTLPYDVGRTSWSRAMQVIRAQPPRRPGAVDRRLRGDVETILLQALEKDPQRRYASAAALAADIRRFLKREPIEAHPASLLYALAMFARRRRALFAAIAVVSASLVAAAAVSTVFAVRAERQRAAAAAQARRAENAEKLAQFQAETAKQATLYLTNLFSALDPSADAENPEPLLGSFAAGEFLDREARRIAEQLEDQPLLQSALLTALGRVYTRLELYGRAADVFRQALQVHRRLLGTGAPSLADNLRALGDVLRRKGEYAAAEPLLREALDLRRHLAPGGSDRSLLVAGSLVDLALIYAPRGECDLAISLLREAVAMEDEVLGGRADMGASVLGLVNTLRAKGDLVSAERLCRETLAQLNARAAGHKVAVAEMLSSLGTVLRDAGDLSGAESAYRQAEALRREHYGDNKPESARSLRDRARLHVLRGEYDAAEALDRRALSILRKRRGEDHNSVGSVLLDLAELQVIRRDSGRGGKPPAVDALYAEAEALHARVKELPQDHLQHSGCLLLLGVLRMAGGDPAGAEPLLRECVERRRQVLSPEHWMTAYAENALGGCLIELQRYEEAEALLLRSYPAIQAQLGRGDDRTVRAVRHFIDLYEACGKPRAAEPYRALLPARP